VGCSGELINGKLMRIHKTIFSSRPDLKAMNTQIQHYLVNVMEPILTMAMQLGFEYPVETVIFKSIVSWVYPILGTSVVSMAIFAL